LPPLLAIDGIEKRPWRYWISFSQTFSAIARIAGPALGGILFGTVGITVIFFINAFSFIISGISEFFIDYHYEKRTDRLNLKKFFVEFGEGFSIVKNIKGLTFSYASQNELFFSDAIENNVALSKEVDTQRLNKAFGKNTIG
jgi:hypothetical protein